MQLVPPPTSHEQARRPLRGQIRPRSRHACRRRRKERWVDEVIRELLRYGWQGLVVAVVLGLGRLAWPILVALLPQWETARRAREDRLLRALQSSTKAMTEAAAAAEAVRQELARLSRESSATREDVRFITEQLELGRGRRPRVSRKELEAG